MILTPSFWAFSYLEPGSEPARTKSVFLLTEEAVRPPCFSMSSLASSRVKWGRVPVRTKVLPLRG